MFADDEEIGGDVESKNWLKYEVKNAPEIRNCDNVY